MKQPKATCILFGNPGGRYPASRAPSILLQKSIFLGGSKGLCSQGRREGVFGLVNPGGRGVTVIQEIWVGGRVKKPCHPPGGCRGCGFFLE